MKVILSPSKLHGEILAQPSKSDAHRKLICAAFAKGTSVIRNVVLSEDIDATLRCVKAAGAEFQITADTNFTDRYSIKILGTAGETGGMREADCGESGSTARFLTMVFAAKGGKTIFSGRGRLPVRPMHSAISFLSNNGITCSYPGDGKYLPLTIEGELLSDDYKIDSSVTSQYISGLMMALPAFSKFGQLTAEGKFESRGYVDVTKQVIESFGVKISGSNPYEIPKNNGLIACETKVEGDWSNASYFLIMKAMGADIEISGIDELSMQPDSVIVRLIKTILEEENPIINVSECPDIMPSLAVLGAVQNKTVKLTGGRRLRAKESDRISSVAVGLTSLGVEVKEFEEGLEIFGKGTVKGGEVNAYNDHRIAMAFSALCVVAEGDIIINGAQSVSKSYPEFFEDLKKLGGNIR